MENSCKLNINLRERKTPMHNNTFHVKMKKPPMCEKNRVILFSIK